MHTLLIAYSGLKKDNYPKLSDAIKDNGKYWWHYLDSVWIIESAETAELVGDKLADLVSEMESEPNLLVVEITGSYQGWLPEKAWDWMKKHVGKQ